jgi:small nuclear ribonucleoprotein (snRNP)-like protein
MTDEEIMEFQGKAVRATLADGRVLAGTLHAEDAHGHGHVHYAIVSDPIADGGEKVVEVVHGATSFVEIEDASDDPAAVE